MAELLIPFCWHSIAELATFLLQQRYYGLSLEITSFSDVLPVLDIFMFVSS